MAGEVTEQTGIILLTPVFLMAVTAVTAAGQAVAEFIAAVAPLSPTVSFGITTETSGGVVGFIAMAPQPLLIAPS